MTRSAVHDPPGCLHEVGHLGELPRFSIVERDKINVLEQLDEIGATRLNPEIHCIAGNELWLVDLLENIELQPRIDVAEEHKGSVAELLRNLGTEAREHPEMSLERLCGVQVVAIAPAPSERWPICLLETSEINPALLEGIEPLHGIVVAD